MAMIIVCHEIAKTCQVWLQDLRGAISNKQDQGNKEESQSQGTRQIRGKDFPSVLAVDFGPGRKFGPILRLKSLLAIPPGAPAVEIVSNIRRADDSHIFSFRSQ